MNKKEHKMLDILKSLRQEFGAISVKAEFEAEGTRTDELLRLIDLARRADLEVGLKIGGCEAVRDLLESKQFGVEYIVAPMVETPYALRKFIEAKNKIYSVEQQKYTDFLFNVETITAFNFISDLTEIARMAGGVNGIVFGRVDFLGSMGLSRDLVDTDRVTDYILKSATMAKENGLNMIVGGAIAKDSIPILKEIKKIHLTRFETRKVIFDATALDNQSIKNGLEKTVYFELMWLENKRDYYAQIQGEDAIRIEMLKKRWEKISAT
jgi:hypothetical protein